MNTFLTQWKKTTRFTTQWQRIEFSSVPAFGRTAIVNIPRKGHLVGRIYLVTELPSVAHNDIYPRLSYFNSVGHCLVEDAEVRIGGNTADRLNSQILEVMDEFYTPVEKVPVVDRLIGRGTNPSLSLNIPLPFWFSSNDPHLWYPIDAVGLDTLSVHVQMRGAAGLLEARDTSGNALAWSVARDGVYMKTPGRGVQIPQLDGSDPAATYTAVELPPFTLGDTYLLVEYVYLDHYEANRLRVTPVEIPIPQHTVLPVYRTGAGVDAARIPVRIGNPTKSLFFFAQREESVHPLANTTEPWLDASIPRGWHVRDEPIKEAALVYEGNQVRYYTTFMDLFRIVMPSLECKKAPAYNNYFYYMGFDIANHERRIGLPCGEANLDRISGVELRLGLRCGSDGRSEYRIYVFAITYNVMRIYGGRAGFLFAF